ncbi:MAG: FMN-dependent NADH-azoreductase [Pseudonocardiales bacterium]|nr:FMN-dependent NADH-azoreductase [Pseudonocardiales bacterium]
MADAFLQEFRRQHVDLQVEVVDLYKTALPAVAGENIESKYSLLVGQPIDRNHADSWRQIELLIEQFKAADAYLISVPMWNFSIPYALKYYIDCLVQPGYVFRFDETGQPVPMLFGKTMTCLSARGGDYRPGTPSHSLDFQEPYLRAIFGYIGITDITFVNADMMDMQVEVSGPALVSALAAATRAAETTSGVI